MSDIIFKTEDYVFSYRVAGIIIHNNCVLLQKPVNEIGYSFPGGHVAFGETNEETLIREFKEEINTDVSVKGLKWVGEIFFPWGKRPCHQICLFYKVDIAKIDEIPLTGSFYANESLGKINFKLEFHWIPLAQIENIELYPLNCKKLLGCLDEGITHFIYRE